MRDRRTVDVPELPDEITPPSLPPEVARLIRLYLERAAMKIERIQASPAYISAFKLAARILRESKPD